MGNLSCDKIMWLTAKIYKQTAAARRDHYGQVSLISSLIKLTANEYPISSKWHQRSCTKKGLYSSDVLITLSEINEICFNKISTGCLRKIRKIPKNFKRNLW